MKISSGFNMSQTCFKGISHKMEKCKVVLWPWVASVLSSHSSFYLFTPFFLVVLLNFSIFFFCFLLSLFTSFTPSPLFRSVSSLPLLLNSFFFLFFHLSQTLHPPRFSLFFSFRIYQRDCDVVNRCHTSRDFMIFKLFIFQVIYTHTANEIGDNKNKIRLA